MKFFPLKYCLAIPVLFFLISCSDPSLPIIIVQKKTAVIWESKEPCRIKYFDADDVVVMPALIKFRGGFSSQYEKHSYTLELDKNYGLAGLPVDDDWILNANYIDKTFMRHKLSYDLYRAMDAGNIASQCAYINLKMNQDNQGLYVLMQEINAGMLGLDKTDSMAVLFKDPPVFTEDRLSNVQEAGNYFQQKYPAIEQDDKTDFMTQFQDFLVNASDEEFNHSISKWIDLENVMDWHVLLLLSNNGDGILKNFYLYKKDTESPLRIAIWDYDHSFGRDGDNELNMAGTELNWHKNILLNRLMNMEGSAYPIRLKNRWFELRQSGMISSDNIRQLVDENQQQFKEALDQNFELWPVNSAWYFDDNNYQQEIDLMLDFVSMNISRLDDYFGVL